MLRAFWIYLCLGGICIGLSNGVKAQDNQNKESTQTSKPNSPNSTQSVGRSKGHSTPLTKADQKKDQKKEWDVLWPDAPSKEVDIETTQGTWMSVDISPDGQWIIFDLLGDLYRIPFEGGDAHPLRTGLAWEMQPRYSPDGRWIAFTSDLKGGDNIWVMNSDPQLSQTQAWPVSEETYRLVNSPSWSPDGQSIVGRKHFTSRRSLGSGEMWVYPWRGGYGGVQLTKKQSKQKDEGEPAFSPNGDFLYYSQDLSAGANFEYNKDSHQGIYGIRQLNLKTGKLTTLTGGPGGAIRPTPSPDGESLAFIRRVEGQSTLWIRQLSSGQESILIGPLERDLQETWAVHGVYPGLAWTPDNQKIVYWAQGHLWKVDVNTKEKTQIPFKVKQTHRLIDPVRFKRRLANRPWFSPQLLRWVKRYKQKVVFQSLGHLYLYDLNTPQNPPKAIVHHHSQLPPPLFFEGTEIDPIPTPLDQFKPNRTFAFSPSWSHDGTQIIYTTWNDKHLGQIRVFDLESGEDQELSMGPGHYQNPLLSKDEQWLIYQRVGGGWITSPRYSHRTGLFALHLPSGTEVKLANRAQNIHFGPDSHSVYFTHSQGEERHLVSVLLSSGLTHLPTPHIIAKGKKLQALSLSPNGRWLAFQSDFSLWITPRPKTGQAVSVSPTQKDRPLFKLADQSGFEPHWSTDSKALYWHLGSTLYHVDLPLDLLSQNPIDSPKKEGVAEFTKTIQRHHLDLKAPLAQPDGPTLALVGARVLTLKTGNSAQDDVIEKGIIIVEGSRILQVGEYDELIHTLPADCRQVNMEGYTIIPGLIDVHAHGSHTAYGITPQSNWQYGATLSFGVTTVHDPSHHSQSIFSARELVQAGLVLGPRIFSTGTILYGAEGSVRADINSLDDAKRHLHRMQSMGAFSVKSYNQPRRNQRQQVLAGARQLKMLVMPEGGSLFHHNMTQIIDGHTGIEHAIPLAHLYSDVIQLWSATSVGYTPTFNVAYGGIMGENYWYQDSPIYAHKRLKSWVPQRHLDARARRPFTAPHMDWNHIQVAESAQKLMKAGVRVHAGAHGQREGLGMHWEMWSMHQGGFTPYEALRAATLHGAEYLGLDQDLGRIQKGYLADFAIIEGNPIKNLRLSEQVKWVMLNGQLYEGQTLARLEPRPADPPFLFFKQDGTQPDEATQKEAECGCHP